MCKAMQYISQSKINILDSLVKILMFKGNNYLSDFTYFPKLKWFLTILETIHGEKQMINKNIKFL